MVWVTMKSGEVRLYNDGGAYSFSEDWLVIGTRKPVSENNIVRLRSIDVSKVEFARPCEIINAPAALPFQTQLEAALRIVLTDAKRASGFREIQLLSDLKTLLISFDSRQKRFKAA
jgi:hypothetical protein